MVKAIQVGTQAVTYEEVRSPDLDRIFNVRVAGSEYHLAANSIGEFGAGEDHPIVAKHPDVVEAILRREYSALVVEYSDGSRHRLPTGHGVVRDAATRELALHLRLGDKINEQAIAVLTIESSEAMSAAVGEALWVHDRARKMYRRACVVQRVGV